MNDGFDLKVGDRDGGGRVISREEREKRERFGLKVGGQGWGGGVELLI